MKLTKMIAVLSAAALSVATLTALTASAEDYLANWERDDSSVEFTGSNWGDKPAGAAFTADLTEYLSEAELNSITTVSIDAEQSGWANYGISTNVLSGGETLWAYQQVGGGDPTCTFTSTDDAWKHWDDDAKKDVSVSVDGFTGDYFQLECWFLNYNQTDWDSANNAPVFGGTSYARVSEINFLDADGDTVLTLPVSQKVVELYFGDKYVQRSKSDPTTIRVLKIVDESELDGLSSADIKVTAGGKTLTVNTDTYYTDIEDSATVDYQLADGAVILSAVIENFPEDLSVDEVDWIAID